MKELLQNRSPARLGATAFAVILAGTLSAGHAAAQTGTITGVVTDDATGQPLESALVRMTGQEGGVLTNENGRYVMPGVATGTHSLTFIIVGYEEAAFEVSVGAGQTAVLDAELAGEAIRIQELVVTGVARATPRVKLPFTVEKVDVANSPVPAISAESFLVGQVPGVKVVRGSGQPGSSGDILLRGATSISGSQDPLIVVDGVITTSGFDDLATLDIESIEVVKGAAGAALYGSRAANGVVQIRTKRGSGFGSDYSRIITRNEVGQARLAGSIQLSRYHPWLTDAAGELAYYDKDFNAVTIPDFTDPDTQLPSLEGNNDPAKSFQDNPWPSRLPLYDHVKRVYSPGTYMSNHLATSGQSGNTNYRASFDRSRDLGVLPDYNDGFGRKGFRLNVDHNVRENLNVSLSTAYTQSEQEDLYDNPFYELTFIGPYVDLLARDPETIGKRHCPPQGCFYRTPDPLTSTNDHPLYPLELRDDRDFQHDVKAAVTARWSPLAWFDVEGLFGLDRNSFSQHAFRPSGAENTDETIDTGYYDRYQSHRRDINAEVTASLQRTFGGFTARARTRYTREDRHFEDFRAYGNDFTAVGVPRLQNLDQDTYVAQSYLQDIIGESYFLISDVDYNGKYILGGLVRRDGSSLFGANQRWHTYYRASVAYRMAQEDWWPFRSVNEFKLSWSQGTAGRRPGFANQYEVYSVSGGASRAISPVTLGNKDLRPQKSTENEYGLDVVLFNKVSTGFTYAQTTSVDQLLSVPLPSVAGFSSQWQNAGTLESKGWEFFVEAPVLETEDLSWTMRLNLDRFSEEITELGRPPFRSGFFYYRDGEVFGAFFGAKWAQACDDLPAGAPCSQFQVNDDGLMVWVGEGNTYTDGMAKNLWGTDSQGMTGDDTYQWGIPIRMFGDCETRRQGGEGCTDFLYNGNTRPDINVSLRNSFRWKGFELYALLDAEFGADIYNQTRQWAYRDNRSGDMDQFGKADGMKKPVLYYQTLYNTNADNAWFVEDGTFIKLREASLRYTLNADWLDSAFRGRVTGIDVTLIGRNLLTFTDYTGYDPEVANNNGGSNVIGRVDNYGYPNSRVFSASVQVIF